jgi:hypothetical protein
VNDRLNHDVSNLSLDERLTHEWPRVRADALREPGALDRVMALLPEGALPPDAPRSVDWDEDPWISGWSGPELTPVEVWEPPCGSGWVDWTHPVYLAQPAALMFDSRSPVGLAVAMSGPELLAPSQRQFLEDRSDRLGDGEVHVVTSTDDPRAWFACSLVRTRLPLGPWRTTGTVLGPALSDDRAVHAIAAYLSTGAPLPRAVAAIFAAFEVLARRAEHRAAKSLGALITPGVGVDLTGSYGGSRRSWISPVDEVRHTAVHNRPHTSFAVQMLSNDHSVLVRRGVAGLPGIRSDLVAVLATDEIEEVRREFLERHRTDLSEEILTLYTEDPSAEIRLQLARITELPDGIYERLTHDPDPTIAELANARLGSSTLRGSDQLRCEYVTRFSKRVGLQPCLNAAVAEVQCDDHESIWLCGTHRETRLCPTVNDIAVRCRWCRTNPASCVDLTGDSGPRPSPVCDSCGDIIADLNNGGVTTEGLDEVLHQIVGAPAEGD